MIVTASAQRSTISRGWRRCRKRPSRASSTSRPMYAKRRASKSKRSSPRVRARSSSARVGFPAFVPAWAPLRQFERTIHRRHPARRSPIARVGIRVVVHPCNRNSASFLDDLRSFVERQKLFGVLLIPPVSENGDLAQLLTVVDCPYVRIASTPLDKLERMIVSHDRTAAAEAGEHLAAHGHKEIGFIAGPPHYRSARERREGFAGALAPHGLKLSPKLSVEGRLLLRERHEVRRGAAGQEAASDGDLREQ